MHFLKSHAPSVLLVVGLLVAMTPVWRWASLPASPTYEEVAQLICTAPAPGAAATAATSSPTNASQAPNATTPAP